MAFSNLSPKIILRVWESSLLETFRSSHNDLSSNLVLEISHSKKLFISASQILSIIFKFSKLSDFIL